VEMLKTIRPMGMVLLFVPALCMGARVARADVEYDVYDPILVWFLCPTEDSIVVPYGAEIEFECYAVDPDKYGPRRLRWVGARRRIPSRACP